MPENSEPLDYEEMLGALQALLGTEVAVHIELRLERRPRPLAMLYGKLRRGELADLTTVEGQQIVKLDQESEAAIIARRALDVHNYS